MKNHNFPIDVKKGQNFGKELQSFTKKGSLCLF